MKIKMPYLLILFMAVASSCIDRFPLEIDTYEDILVVDGILHNEQGPYTIKLSRSASVATPEYLPVRNAAVKILDDQGNYTVLSEMGQGVYMTDPNEFRGISGRSYKLSIILANGETYESSFNKLNNSVAIDSIYVGFETIPTIDPEYDQKGFRFYINPAQPSFDTTYFLWHLTETYKYHAAFQLEFLFDRFSIPYAKPVLDIDSLYYCYLTDEVPFFHIETTVDKTTSKLNKVPLHYVSTETNKLSIRYSLLAKQYTINAEAYAYWKALKEQLTNDDILFNSQPFQLRGNVKNISDPSEPVMGYFTVAGATYKRIYMNRPENVDISEAECPFDDGRILLYYLPQLWPIYIGKDLDGKSGPAEKHCFDCRMRGGELEKPDFWIEGDGKVSTY